MRKLYLNANKKLELRIVIEVKQLENDEDWEYVFWGNLKKGQFAVF